MITDRRLDLDVITWQQFSDIRNEHGSPGLPSFMTPWSPFSFETRIEFESVGELYDSLIKMYERKRLVNAYFPLTKADTQEGEASVAEKAQAIVYLDSLTEVFEAFPYIQIDFVHNESDPDIDKVRFSYNSGSPLVTEVLIRPGNVSQYDIHFNGEPFTLNLERGIWAVHDPRPSSSE